MRDSYSEGVFSRERMKTENTTPAVETANAQPVMVATISGRACKYSSSHRKERGGFIGEYAALVPCAYRADEMRAAVTLRLYWPGDVACYAYVWANNDTLSVNGSGKAGGYGYCKKSAAAGAAIRNAGFDLSERIDGVGEDAIRRAVLAVAAALGYPEARLHVSHP